MAVSRVNIIVDGLVQGVGFRWFARSAAQRRSITGYVRNRPNGTVEIVAEGDNGLLQDLIKEIRIGPSAARVTGLSIEWDEPEDEVSQFTQFEVR